MKALTSFYQSSIGRKWIVALTGMVLVAFVTGHLIGNLQIFLPPEAINLYAERLQGLGDILWVIRFVLLATILLHIGFTVKLAIDNAGARPIKYAVQKSVAATIAAKTMLWSGGVLPLFIVYHLLHFTVQQFHPEWKTWMDAEGRHDVHDIMIAGFQNPLVSAFYLFSVFVLCFHMSHGIQSFLQTLGGRTRKLAQPISQYTPFIAWAIFAGYASIPLAVLTHVLNFASKH